MFALKGRIKHALLVSIPEYKELTRIFMEDCDRFGYPQQLQLFRLFVLKLLCFYFFGPKNIVCLETLLFYLV